MSITYELNLSKNAYASGNPTEALHHTSRIFSASVCQADFSLFTQEQLFEYLDAITLHQSLLILCNRPMDYLNCEPYVKRLTYLLFDSNADFYYALHAFDACESMALHCFLSEAYTYKQTALALIDRSYGVCPYLTFMEAICDAQISFYMEDFYTCIQAATLANSLWYSSENEQISMPYAPDEAAAFHTIERIGINNLLLLCNAYGKINNPKESIALLESILSEGGLDHYQTVSAEITLAELYLIAGKKDAALPFYEKYKASNFAGYPGLAAALGSIAYTFETETSDFLAAMNTTSYCYSQNMFTISRYNYGLGLASSGRFDEALAQFQSVGKTGYSMRLSLLAVQNRTSEIESLRTEVNDYFYRQIHQIIAHYKEELAYNHLSKLQYHIDLTLGAYCHTELSPIMAYEFLLNTKHIALETTFLQKMGKERSLYNAAQLMQTLDEQSVLIEYTCLRTLDTVSYGVFVVSKHQISYVALGETATIDAILKEWHRLLHASHQATGYEKELLLASCQDIATRLRKALYLPVKALLTGYEKLLIAPAGAMINFPFSQLPTSAAGTLGDNHTICYLNTGKELLCKPSSTVPLSNNSNHALVVGNPSVTQFANLPFAETEADMVAYFLHSVPFKKECATLENIRTALNESPAFMHIAAHGIYQTPASQNENVDWDRLYHAMCHSGIILADDTLLSCADIATLDLNNVKLAVLSCCHLGQAAYLGTEGAYGLRRALALAGCDTLILNLWQVDDTASFLWMKAFYESLTITGSPVEDAFLTAQNAVKNFESDGFCPYASPYYWAGFILISPH